MFKMLKEIKIILKRKWWCLKEKVNVKREKNNVQEKRLIFKGENKCKREKNNVQEKTLIFKGEN